MQTPLLLRALVGLGCVARVAPGARRRRGDGAGESSGAASAVSSAATSSGAGAGGFALDALELVPGGVRGAPYLHPSVARFQRALLYYTGADNLARDGRACVVLFLLEGSNADLEGERDGAPPPPYALRARAHVWVVDPHAKGRGPHPPPVVRRVFARARAQMGFVGGGRRGHGADAMDVTDVTEEGGMGGAGGAGTTPSSASCEFETASVVRTPEAALAACAATLAAHRASLAAKRGGATLLLLRAREGAAAMRRAVPLLSEFPTVEQPLSAAERALPALGWQASAVEGACRALLECDGRLRAAVSFSRYAHVPLGNLGADPACTAADVAFARLLRHNRKALWATPLARPDLGGAESDENEAWSDNRPAPSVSTPGAYRCVCVELELFGLAVGAVVAAPHLNQQDLAAAATAAGVVGAGVSDEAPAGDAFRLLQSLVADWLRDVRDKGSADADGMLQHFYRRLSSRAAALHEPALHALVHALMTRVFHRLVAECRRLGAVVVHASFERVIIATGKRERGLAERYVLYFVGALTACDVFQVREESVLP